MLLNDFTLSCRSFMWFLRKSTRRRFSLCKHCPMGLVHGKNMKAAVPERPDQNLSRSSTSQLIMPGQSSDRFKQRKSWQWQVFWHCDVFQPSFWYYCWFLAPLPLLLLGKKLPPPTLSASVRKHSVNEAHLLVHLISFQAQQLKQPRQVSSKLMLHTQPKPGKPLHSLALTNPLPGQPWLPVLLPGGSTTQTTLFAGPIV